MKIITLERKESIFAISLIVVFIVGIIIGIGVGAHSSHRRHGNYRMGGGMGYSRPNFGTNYSMPMMGGTRQVGSPMRRYGSVATGTSPEATPGVAGQVTAPAPANANQY